MRCRSTKTGPDGKAVVVEQPGNVVHCSPREASPIQVVPEPTRVAEPSDNRVTDMSKPTWEPIAHRVQLGPSRARTAPRANASGRSHLRIVQINDVYDVDHLPRFKTALSSLHEGTDRVIAVLPGDFVSPSILSMMDKGRGMVEVLNSCCEVVELYVCLGNHEQDHGPEELARRINESRFVWLNTNMRGFLRGNKAFAQKTWAQDMEMPHHKVLVVSAGGRQRHVGLLGLLEPNQGSEKEGWSGKSAWFNGPNWGNVRIDRVAPCAASAAEQLADCDLHVPLTHAYIDNDRDLARRHGAFFPLILGGHDHEPFLETVGAATIVKTGLNAERFGVIDITWPDFESADIDMRVRFVDATDFEPEPACNMLVQELQQVTHALRDSTLFQIPSSLQLSSQLSRFQSCTMGILLASCVRDTLCADCCLLSGGSIRGDKDYSAGKAWLTYEDLRIELPFNSPVLVAQVPGDVLSDAVSYSRTRLKGKGGFLQTCDALTLDAENRVTHVGGAPLEAGHLYNLACQLRLLLGEGASSAGSPLVDYGKDRFSGYGVEDSSLGVREVIVSGCSKQIWWQLTRRLANDFNSIDRSRDGRLSKEEVAQAITDSAACGSGSMSSAMRGMPTRLVLDNLFACVDIDDDGYITQEEHFKACILSPLGLAAVKGITEETVLTRESASTLWLQIAGSHDESLACRVFNDMDADHSGTITYSEWRQAVAKHVLSGSAAPADA